jgi:hypothetical protein
MKYFGYRARNEEEGVMVKLRRIRSGYQRVKSLDCLCHI